VGACACGPRYPLPALCALVYDRVVPYAPRRPGRPKKLSDPDLACLAVAPVLVGTELEGGLRMCHARPEQLSLHPRHQPHVYALAARRLPARSACIWRDWSIGGPAKRFTHLMVPPSGATGVLPRPIRNLNDRSDETSRSDQASASGTAAGQCWILEVHGRLVAILPAT
jgi:hypothetical protein